MDPVIVVGAGPVGLTLALALARHGVPSVVLDEGPGKDEQRLARTIVLRADTAALVERLTGAALSLPLPAATAREGGPLRAEDFDDTPLRGRGGGPAGDRSGHGARDGARDEAEDGAEDGAETPGTRWRGWRSLRRKQTLRQATFADVPVGATSQEPSAGSAPPGTGSGATPGAPVHLPQHALTQTLRQAVAEERLVKLVTDSRLDSLEQDDSGVTAHTRGDRGTWWRGSHLVGCDGPRSTVRKLLDIRFPGRSGVERHAVAALRTELPWPQEAVLHRAPPWRGAGPEITARPLPHGAWRLDWLLPSSGELVTPDALVTRVRDTLAGWCGGTTPPYELLDTGVHTVHHRLARRWRAGRVFLAGDAAHLLGALGTQGLDEGLRDADNLAWKLASAWHHGASQTLLDSYQAERRAAITARLRAADQSLPILRGGGGLRGLVPGATRAHDTLLSDAHLGRGPLGAAPSYARSPLAPPSTDSVIDIGTAPGQAVADVRVTAEDGTFVRLRERLGRGAFLVLLIAPGTGVWERRHWMTAGVMPRLAAAVTALPRPAELLVAESYPGAPAHTVLLIRPDGHLVTALGGVRPAELYGAADAARGGAPAPGPGRQGSAPDDVRNEGEGEGEGETDGASPRTGTSKS